MERRAPPGAWGRRRRSLAPAHPGRDRGVPPEPAPCPEVFSLRVGAHEAAPQEGTPRHQGRRGGKRQGPGPAGACPPRAAWLRRARGGPHPSGSWYPQCVPCCLSGTGGPRGPPGPGGAGWDWPALGSGVLRGCGLELELGCGFPWAHPSRPAQGGSNRYRGGWLPEQQGNKESKAMAFGGQTGLPRPQGLSCCQPVEAGGSPAPPGLRSEGQECPWAHRVGDSCPAGLTALQSRVAEPQGFPVRGLSSGLSKFRLELFSQCQVHGVCGCSYGDAGVGFSLSRDTAGRGNGGVPAGGERTPHPHRGPQQDSLAPGCAGQGMKSRWAWEQRPAASPGSRLVTVQGSRWPNSFRTVVGEPGPGQREGQGASEGAPQGLATPAPESHPAQPSAFPGFFPPLFWLRASVSPYVKWTQTQPLPPRRVLRQRNYVGFGELGMIHPGPIQ